MRLFRPRLTGLLTMMPMLTIPAQAASAFQSGEWKITTRTEVPGLPFVAPAVTTRQCLILRDRIPQGKDASGEYKLVDQNISGDTVRWTMRCGNANGTTEAKGEATYSGRTMQGVSHITTSGRGDTMQMTSRMTGRHIGPCQ